jgi:hypothetical protein
MIGEPMKVVDGTAAVRIAQPIALPWLYGDAGRLPSCVCIQKSQRPSFVEYSEKACRRAGSEKVRGHPGGLVYFVW